MKAIVHRVDSLFRHDAAISPPPSDVLIQPFATVARPANGIEKELVATYSIYLLHPQQRCNAPGCRVDNGEGPKFGVSINKPLDVMGVERLVR